MLFVCCAELNFVAFCIGGAIEYHVIHHPAAPQACCILGSRSFTYVILLAFSREWTLRLNSNTFYDKIRACFMLWDSS